MSDTDLHSLTVDQLKAAFLTKQLSPVEAAEAAFARIDNCNDAVNAFVFIDRDAAMASAKEAETRWRFGEPLSPIDGIPTTLKDTMLAKGWPTLRGSKTTDSDGPWDTDAPPVERLREAGAVFLGKTTTPEFGWKGITDSALSGVTRNPWNTSRTTGGSSGGAVAAAALGMGVLHTGTDAGGSVRIPASFTGVFSIKPTYGRVPAWPASPFGTLSHTGPITRTVRDAAVMLNVMSKPDIRDWTALPFDGRNHLDGIEDGVKGLKIAYSPTLGHVNFVHPDIAKRVDAAAKAFEELGAVVEQVDPDLVDAESVFETHWFASAAAAGKTVPIEKQFMLDRGLRDIMDRGRRIAAADYIEAASQRARIGERMQAFFQDYDLLLTPGQPMPAFTAGIEFPEGYGFTQWHQWTPFTYPFNLTQQPAAAVPCGFTADGLPAGLQLVGPLFQDTLVLRAARAYENLNPFQMPVVPIQGK
jgi:aspartyl-tRNA(Asn)/glutamyl-tRNA(Gln) amidotransferase subunit A